MTDKEFLASIDRPSVVISQERYDELIAAEKELQTIKEGKK